MKLILAQGNPGERYAKTRHNVGWQILDRVVAEGDWREKAKFSALIAEATIDTEPVLFVKPTTFYNETGRSARAIVDFYKLDPSRDVLVLHDELALPFGTIRVREKGSDAGNNGIKSLNAHLGQDYTRLRIGIEAELRSRMGDVDFVLSSFSRDETEKLNTAVIPHACELIEDFVRGTLIMTSHRHH